MTSPVDLFVIYKFVKLLATPWNQTDAYKLGLIDETGKRLVKRKDLKNTEEKNAFSIFHLLVWNIKRLIEKIPGGNTRLGSFAAALWLIKEQTGIDTETLEKAFQTFLEEANIQLPAENLCESKKPTRGLYYLNESPIIFDTPPVLTGNILGVDVYKYGNKTFTLDMLRRIQ